MSSIDDLYAPRSKQQMMRRKSDAVIKPVKQPTPNEEYRSPYSQSKQRTPWYLIHPDSKWLQNWDALVGSTLIFVALVTPFEVAFLPAPRHVLEPLFLINRVVDSVFCVDVCFSCLTMFPSVRDPSRLETRLSSIIRHYLRGWFLIDIMALASSAFDVLPVLEGSSSEGGTEKKSPLTSLRVIRILRLIKLVRLIQGSQKLRAIMSELATPRSILSAFSALLEALYLMHLFACILSLITIIPQSPLDTWLATHGYCQPLEDGSGSDDELAFECVPPGDLYLICYWWSAGLILGAPISLAPNQGPYERHFSSEDGRVKFTRGENLTLLVLKTIAAFFFLTVTARFVTMYNNLDPDTKAFNQRWDALNRFISYFKVSKDDARQLRRYYMERGEEQRATSRKRTLNDFSPYLSEKFVWKLNKDWLMKVPCFNLVVERLRARPESGMERFLVRVALEMKPALFVPTEKPPGKRLYIVTDGEAFLRGQKLVRGDTWGAEDVLLQTSYLKNMFRATAATYLHTLWVDKQSFEMLRKEYPDGYILTKLWANVYAAGTAIVHDYRKMKKKVIQVKMGYEPGMVAPEQVEQALNRGDVSVVPLRDVDGLRQFSSDTPPLPMYTFRYDSVNLEGYEIVKEPSGLGKASGSPLPLKTSRTSTLPSPMLLTLPSLSRSSSANQRLFTVRPAARVVKPGDAASALLPNFFCIKDGEVTRSRHSSRKNLIANVTDSVAGGAALPLGAECALPPGAECNPDSATTAPRASPTLPPPVAPPLSPQHVDAEGEPSASPPPQLLWPPPNESKQRDPDGRRRLADLQLPLPMRRKAARETEAIGGVGIVYRSCKQARRTEEADGGGGSAVGNTLATAPDMQGVTDANAMSIMLQVVRTMQDEMQQQRASQAEFAAEARAHFAGQQTAISGLEAGFKRLSNHVTGTQWRERSQVTA